MHFEYAFGLLTNVRMNITPKYIEDINIKVLIYQNLKAVVHFYMKYINRSVVTASTVIGFIIIILVVIVTTATIIITED
jgi:hypothetical protein